MKIKSFLFFGFFCLAVFAEDVPDLSSLNWQFAEPYLRGGLEAEERPSVAEVLWRGEVNTAYASLRHRLHDEYMLERLVKYLFHSGRFFEACESAWAGLQVKADKPSFLFMLTAGLIFEGDYRQAERLIELLEAERGEEASFIHLLAWSLHRQGKYLASNEQLVRIASSGDLAVILDLNRAVNFLKLGRLEEAKPLLAVHVDEVEDLLVLRVNQKKKDVEGEWVDMKLEEVVLPKVLRKAEMALHKSLLLRPEPAPLKIEAGDEDDESSE